MNRLFVFIIYNLSFIIPINGQVIFHEDFEVPDSVVSGGVNGDWYTGSTLQTSGVYCDSAAYGVGGSAYLKTIPFSTQGYNAVFLSFNHICKLEFFDRGTVEVSPDSGITWIPLCSQYLSHSVFISQSCRFSEASYVEWVPGQNQTPSNSWWKPRYAPRRRDAAGSGH